MSSKFSFGKMGFEFSLATKMLKNLDLYAYFFQKRRDFDETKYMSFLIKR